MQKWDFLQVARSGHNILIRSTDPGEVAAFCEILNKRFSGRDRIFVSPDRYCAEFEGYGVTHDFLQSSTKQKPFITDVYYALIIAAQERGWEPYEGFGKFIRPTLPGNLGEGQSNSP